MARFCIKNVRGSVNRIGKLNLNRKIYDSTPKEINVITECSINGIKEDIIPDIKKEDVIETKTNKKTKKSKEMNTYDKIQMANAILGNENTTQTYKRVKKDKGLIERTESSKIVLTEDNKELLND